MESIHKLSLNEKNNKGFNGRSFIPDKKQNLGQLNMHLFVERGCFCQTDTTTTTTNNNNNAETTSTDYMYLEKKGGRGFTSIEDTVDASKTT